MYKIAADSTVGRLWFLLCAFASVTVLFAAETLFATEAAGDSQGCHELVLHEKPVWTFSGAFTPRGDLVLADVGGRRLLKYGTRDYLDSFDSTAPSLESYNIQLVLGNNEAVGFVPTGLHAVPGLPLYMLGVGSDQIVTLTLDKFENFAVGRTYEIIAKDEGEGLKSLVQWVPVSENRIVAFGDISLGNGNWTSAFVEINLKEPAKFKIIEEVSIASDARHFYFLGQPYLASAGAGNTFFIVMNETPEIHSVNHPNKTSRVVPWAGQDSVQRHALPSNWGRRSVVAAFEAVEDSNIPTALISWEGAVHLVSRRNIGDPGLRDVRWFLSELGSSSGAQVVLPMAGAQHVTVVPGSRYWALLGKGPVLGPRRQNIRTLTLIPAVTLRSALDEADKKNTTVELCRSVTRVSGIQYASY